MLFQPNSLARKFLDYNDALQAWVLSRGNITTDTQTLNWYRDDYINEMVKRELDVGMLRNGVLLNP